MTYKNGEEILLQLSAFSFRFLLQSVTAFLFCDFYLLVLWISENEVLASKVVDLRCSGQQPSAHVAFEHVICDGSEVRCVVSIKYTPDHNDKYFSYTGLNKIYF